ncbi:MAG: YbbR-like domain-containing protein [Candidatus Omnitrophica bacterium]|nr:YbbR-like domain-containing protein [Candidatus Omnitrophota bacterium]
MTRWGSNGGLLFLSFLMAVGIVWIKGQERIDSRTVGGVPVSVENLPANLVLPERWSTPEATVTLQGPRNVLEMIRAVQCGFFIPFSDQILPEGDEPRNMILNASMFRTSMTNDDNQVPISVVETSIHPRQASIHLLPWDITQEQPEYKDLLSPDVITIPIYRVQKEVSVIAPVTGSPPNGLKFRDVVIDPPKILITGPKDAVARINSVSTDIFDLNYVLPQTPPQYMALPDLTKDFSVWPVEKNIRGVTVTIRLAK